MPSPVTMSIVATICFIAVACFKFGVAWTWERFCSYGRETLIGGAMFFVYVAVVRAMYVPLGLISLDTSRLLLGYGGIVAVVSIAQVFALHWALHRKLKWVRKNYHDLP